MAEQQEMYAHDKLDPDVAKAADMFVEAIKLKKSVKEKYDIREKNLMGMLKKMGKSKIRHKGFVIEVTHKDESDALKIKEEKGAKEGRKKKKKPLDSEDKK